MEINKKSMNNYFLYKHVNKINGKVYIGITRQKPKRRWGKDGNGYKSNSYFYNAIKKYGWNNFGHIILLNNLSYQQARYFEWLFSVLYKSTDKRFGYNFVCGEKRKLNISESTRKKCKRFGKNNGMSGKQHSKETKEKLKVACYKSAHFGSDNKQSKAVVGINGDERLEFESANQAAEYFNLFNDSHIIECCKGKRKTCAGYIWTYK